MKPLLDLLAIAVPYLAWPLFRPHGQAAHYVMVGALVVYFGWRLRSLGWQWLPVAWFASLVGAQQAVCGSLFVANGGHVCDDGTGYPFSVLTALALTLCALYYRSRHG